MTEAITQDIPAHVPEDLVFAWDPMAAEGASEDPYTANAFLYEKPDIFYSPTHPVRGDGLWIVTSYEKIREILQDPETFSSHGIAGFSALLGETWPLIPLEIDPPNHAQYRMIVNPLFAPKRIDEIADSIRENAVTLIEGLKKEERFDFVPRFGQQFPISVVMSLVGLDLKDLPTWVKWGEGLLHGKTIEDRVNAAASIKEFLVREIASRRETPRDDVMSKVVNAEIKGRRLDETEALGMMYLIFVGGLDTVASTLGFMFRYLSLHPELQRRLRAEPEKIPDALEEMMRAHGIVNPPRLLTKDIEFHGVSMKKGEHVFMAQSIACRDPKFHARPNEIDIDREDRQHMLFSAGPHRCMGSHLARKEMWIAIEEWMSRAPEFAPDPDRPAIAQAGGVWGMYTLPLVWKR